MICTCGDPTALGVVHLRTRPCFHYVEREWVGLTDKDRQELAAEQHSWEELCFAVEAKLKEKNT